MPTDKPIRGTGEIDAVRSTADLMDAIEGGEPLALSPYELLQMMGSVFRAESIAHEALRLYGEWAASMFDASDREIPLKDPRFADPTWRENPFYRRLALGYMSFCDAVDRLVEAQPGWRERERARFMGGILVSALSPTNTLLGNPAALKHAYETAGMSLVQGARNMWSDLIYNKGMPSQVKASAFRVGANLAATPGAVVFRNEMVELLQFQPATSEVCAYPTLMIAPPIGKYYFMDLAPQRSFIEYAVSRGIPFFTTSWRNPQAQHAQWDLDHYVQTCLELVDAVCTIAGSDKLNILGLCAGGIISTLMLNYMAANGDARVNAATLGVTLLDFGAEAPIAAFHAKPVLSLAQGLSRTKGILPAESLASVFAWMRPNDLIWNYWVNNYLMGKEPPSHDILAWSVDATNLPSALHAQFLDIFERNVLLKPGAIKVLGEPIDLKRIKVETLVTGALADHLTPWKACYRTTQLLGGPSTFVLSNGGHIASLVNPPGNPKANYYLGPRPESDPEQWLEKAQKHTGSWWEVWAEWTLQRGAGQRGAPSELGNERYPVRAAAPGEYVLEKA
jgi:polyhydroxyalkanoate synthase subunit PhaC